MARFSSERLAAVNISVAWFRAHGESSRGWEVKHMSGMPSHTDLFGAHSTSFGRHAFRHFVGAAG